MKNQFVSHLGKRTKVEYTWGFCVTVFISSFFCLSVLPFFMNVFIYWCLDCGRAPLKSGAARSKNMCISATKQNDKTDLLEPMTSHRGQTLLNPMEATGASSPIPSPRSVEVPILLKVLKVMCVV